VRVNAVDTTFSTRKKIEAKPVNVEIGTEDARGDRSQEMVETVEMVVMEIIHVDIMTRVKMGLEDARTITPTTCTTMHQNQRHELDHDRGHQRDNDDTLDLDPHLDEVSQI
jgi:ABC-type transporter MlaC component